LPTLLCAVIFTMSACHTESDMAAMQQFQDSLFARYPGKVGAIHINPEDRENLIVALGAPALYELSPADRQTEAIQIGAMALRIFGEGSYLKTGRLVLTRDANNAKNDPADGISTDMKLDSLIKARLKK
jgi:hypothetical protein